jgi:uncharacterized membrane protein YkoI
MRKWRAALLLIALPACGLSPLAAQVAPPAKGATPSVTDELRVASEAKCWTDWSEAAAVVRRETLMPVERVNKLARDRHPGAEIIKVTLCEEHGKFVYRLVLREKQGQLKSELLDAR